MEAEQTGTPEKRKRRPWEKAFLAALSQMGNITAACRTAKVGRTTIYSALENWPDFTEEFKQAETEAAELLELEARRRAQDGVDDPVIYKGELMGVWVGPDGQVVSKDTAGARQIPLTVKKYSDTLLIFLLKGALPEKYRERHEHSGKDGGPIKYANLSDEELDKRIAELEGRLRGNAGRTNPSPVGDGNDPS